MWGILLSTQQLTSTILTDKKGKSDVVSQMTYTTSMYSILYTFIQLDSASPFAT